MLTQSSSAGAGTELGNYIFLGNMAERGIRTIREIFNKYYHMDGISRYKFEKILDLSVRNYNNREYYHYKL